MTERWAVLGGGIAGLAFAHRALALRPDLDLVVLEAEPRPGGVIRTDRSEGFSCEWGPSGVLAGAPRTLALADELGLSGRWIERREAAKLRFVQWRGRLHPLPLGPGALLRTGLLSPRGRLRLLAEPLVRRRKTTSLEAAAAGIDPKDASDGAPETIADFGRRRLGRQAVATLLDPFITGVFAGDVEELELAACLPKIARMEAEHGSLFTALRRGGAGHAPVLRSLVTGMEELVQGLRRSLGERLFLARRVEAVTRADARLAVHVGGLVPERIEADRIVCCLPARPAAEVLRPLSEGLADDLSAIPSTGIVSVHLGITTSDATDAMTGFGWLVPSAEGGPVLGCLFVSEIFAGRAPQGKALLRFMLGGTRAPQCLAMADAELLAVCERSLHTATGFAGKILFARVHRIPRAIPQYVRGHLARLARIDRALESLPGLHLLGASYRGVSVNDVIDRARGEAERLAGG
jgi:oxygen-dependent protoporphyrinogen oxidase